MQIIYYVHMCKRLFIVKMLQPQKKSLDMFCQYIPLWQLRLTLSGRLKLCYVVYSNQVHLYIPYLKIQ